MDNNDFKRKKQANNKNKKKNPERTGMVEWMLFFQTHFYEKTSHAFREFAVVTSWCFLQAVRQLVKIVAVCFITMGHILCREAVSSSVQSMDVPLGTCGCAFQQVGLILKRKT